MATMIENTRQLRSSEGLRRILTTDGRRQCRLVTMFEMKQSPLIAADALAERLGREDWIVVDCRFTLTDPPSGRKAYERGHIPGARYAHLDDDLARAPGPVDGRHPLPEPTVFAATLGRWGVTSAATVVAYDDASGAIAARLWWLLGWIGHEPRAV